ALALAGLRGDLFRIRAGRAAPFLDSLEVLRLAVAALDRPTRAAGEHRVHLVVVEPNLAGAADAGGNVAEQRVGERLLPCLEVRALQARVEAADAARDVETDAAGRDDAAFVRIEGGDAAYGEAVAPMRVRHRVRGADDPRQRRDVAELLVDLHIHRADQRLAAVDHARHAHRAARRDAPFVVG